MKLRFIPIVAGLSLAALFTALAQDGPGPEPARGIQPAGNAFSTQYRNGNALGGAGPGTAGQVLTSNGAGMAPTFQDAAGGSPGGNDTEVQFNDGGAFAGDSTFTFDGTTVTVPDLTVTGTCTGCGGGGGAVLSALKTENTSRSNTATLAADPDLAFAEVPSGIYLVNIRLQISGNASGGGFDWNIALTGTLTGSHECYLRGVGALGGTFDTGQTAAVSSPLTEVTSTIPNTNTTIVMHCMGRYNFSTNATDVAVAWAQNSSASGATRLDSGSYIYLTSVEN